MMSGYLVLICYFFFVFFFLLKSPGILTGKRF